MSVDDIALTMAQGLGTKGIAHLLSVMGSAAAIFSATEDELVQRAELKPSLAREILSRNFHREAEKEMQYMEKHSLTAVASTDPEYPALLRECPDYPHVLYVRGDAGALGGERMLSMVGTRRITPYGQRMCDALIGRLGELVKESVVVSGLAFGVDAGCHRAALDYGLRTVAVVPCCLPDVVPTQNSRLADEIVDRGGAVITELHSRTKQNGSFYIPRNRIVAGISSGVVVVESPLDGGSLSTAEFAYGYDRVVMAVPGRAGDRCSEGANMLIKHRRAAMVSSGDDIVHELGWDIRNVGEMPRRPAEMAVLTADERRLAACFGDGESLDLDTLAQRSGMSVGETAGALLSMEIGGVVRALPGKVYEII